MRVSRRSFTTAAGAASMLLPITSLAQGATPQPSSSQAELQAAQYRFTQWLELLPGGRLDEELDVTWVDFQRQVTALGGSWSISTEERMRYLSTSQYGNLPPFMQYGAVMGDVMGFDMINVTQAAASGRAPSIVQLVELDIDPMSLIAQWESVDYQHRENEYGEFWTIGEDGEISLSHPVQQMMIASFNNIAILDDRRIAAAPRADLLEELMSAHDGHIENRAAELAPVGTGLPDDGASLWILSGEIFMRVAEDAAASPSSSLLDRLAESDDAVGPMPVLRTLGIGTTAGVARDIEHHVDDSSHFLILETDTANMAQQAADVVVWRVQNMVSEVTGQPYADLLGELETEVISPDVVRISCSGDAAIRGVFTRMVQMNDGWPFIHMREN